MRIRVIQTPPSCSIEGIQFGQFESGRIYEVGVHIGGVLLAAGWAEPADLAPVQDDEPATSPTIKLVREGPRDLRDIAADYCRPKRE